MPGEVPHDGQVAARLPSREEFVAQVTELEPRKRKPIYFLLIGLILYIAMLFAGGAALGDSVFFPVASVISFAVFGAVAYAMIFGVFTTSLQSQPRCPRCKSAWELKREIFRVIATGRCLRCAQPVYERDSATPEPPAVADANRLTREELNSQRTRARREAMLPTAVWVGAGGVLLVFGNAIAPWVHDWLTPWLVDPDSHLVWATLSSVSVMVAFWSTIVWHRRSSPVPLRLQCNAHSRPPRPSKTQGVPPTGRSRRNVFVQHRLGGWGRSEAL